MKPYVYATSTPVQLIDAKALTLLDLVSKSPKLAGKSDYRLWISLSKETSFSLTSSPTSKPHPEEPSLHVVRSRQPSGMWRLYWPI